MKYLYYYLIDIIPFLLISALIIIVIRYFKCKKTGSFNVKYELVNLFFYLYLVAIFLKTVVPDEFLHFNFTKAAFTPLSDAVIYNNPEQTYIYIRAFYIEHRYFGLFDIFISNLIMLIPFGLLFPYLYPKRKSETVIIAFIISSTIEILQLFTPRITDTFDIFLNTLGAIVGYICFNILQKHIKKGAN